MQNHSSQSSDPRQKAAQDKENLKQQGKEQAEAYASRGKEQAADQLDDFSRAIDQAASSFSEQDKEGFASYLHKSSEQLADLSRQLHERSVEDLSGDVKRLARENPSAVMMGSIALGFGLSRFLKASQSGHEVEQRVASAADRSGGREAGTNGPSPGARPTPAPEVTANRNPVPPGTP